MNLVLVIFSFRLIEYVCAASQEMATGDQSSDSPKYADEFLTIGQQQRDRTIPKIDMAIIIDVSRKTDVTSFVQIKSFLQKTLSYFSISHGTTKVALIRCSTSSVVNTRLDGCTNRKSLTNYIKDMKYENADPDLEKGLEQARSAFTQTNQGSRPGAKNIVLLLSDGYSVGASNMQGSFGRLKNEARAELYIVKVNKAVDSNALKQIASTFSQKGLYETNQALPTLAEAKQTTVPYTRCSKEGQVVTDECNRRCLCVAGQMSACFRVRREILDMSIPERTYYIATYKKMGTEQPYKAKYEALTGKHATLFSRGIHNKDVFLPWHRGFILDLENVLQEIDCKVTISYWAWSLWSRDPWSSRHLWTTAPHGIGSSENGRCISQGVFGTSQGWKQPGGKCLTRQFSRSAMKTEAEVQRVVNTQDFHRFELGIRSTLHNTVHSFIGGTMNSHESAYAPEFFLHHTYIDKIWADWQKKTKRQRRSFYTSTQKLPGLQYSSPEVVCIESQPGCVKVLYDDPKSNGAEQIRAFLSISSVKAIKDMPIQKGSKTPQAAFDLFKTPQKEQVAVHKMEDDNDDNEVNDNDAKTKLTGAGKRLGFNVPKVRTDDKDVVSDVDNMGGFKQRKPPKVTSPRPARIRPMPRPASWNNRYRPGFRGRYRAGFRPGFRRPAFRSRYRPRFRPRYQPRYRPRYRQQQYRNRWRGR